MNRRYLIVVLVAAFMSVISCVQAENISRTFFENDPITRDANVATLVETLETELSMLISHISRSELLI